MNKPKSFALDVTLWILLMVLASGIAFSLLQRDKQRHFGAIAYGGFPEFNLKTIQGRSFDIHQLKSAVWAIHQGTSRKAQQIANELVLIANTTASGKRHMNVLTFTGSGDVFNYQTNKFHYILKASDEELKTIFDKLGDPKEDIVLLIDQDRVIRGRYDFSSPDDFRSFRQDLLRIL